MPADVHIDPIDAVRYRIARDPRRGMLTDVRVYASRTLIEQIRRDLSLEQAMNVATLPGIVGPSLAMPDIHQGYGFPIGGVAATDWEQGVVSPGGVGFDINCGVRLIRTSLAAAALTSIALEPDAIEPRERYPMEAAGPDLESLLVNFLNEVLWLLDGRRLALCGFTVGPVADRPQISAFAFGEPFDPARHRAKLLVKGITWHQLRVEREGDGWVAQVFLDI